MKEVYVIGLGAHTSVGRTMASSAAAVGANVGMLKLHPTAVDTHGERVTVAMASYLEKDLPVVDRMIELSVPAIDEALRLLRHVDSVESAIPLILGLPVERPGLPASFVKDVSSGIVRSSGRGSMLSGVQTVVAGHSAGLIAIEQAIAMIREGKCSVCLAGGCDSYISTETLEWFDSNGWLRSNNTTTGFFPGEGAGVCLIASEESDLARSPLAKVLAVATFPKGREKPSGGSRRPHLSASWEAVLHSLPPEGAVDQLLCDLNTQKARSDEFSFSLTKCIQQFSRDFFYTTPAMSWGDVGAASGPLLIGLTIAPQTSSQPRGPIGLVSTSSENGVRSAALLSVGPTA